MWKLVVVKRSPRARVPGLESWLYHSITGQRWGKLLNFHGPQFLFYKTGKLMTLCTTVIKTQIIPLSKHYTSTGTWKAFNKNVVYNSLTPLWLGSSLLKSWDDWQYCATCSEFSTFTSLFKVKHIKPLKTNSEKLQDLSIYLHNFEESSATKYNGLKEQIFPKTLFKIILIQKNNSSQHLCNCHLVCTWYKSSNLIFTTTKGETNTLSNWVL